MVPGLRPPPSLKKPALFTAALIWFLLFQLFPLLPAVAGKYYWVGGSGRWSEISHWATSSGGNTFHPVVPGPTDTVYFDANSGFSPGNNQIIINTGATCHTMIWDGAEANPRLVGEYRQSLTIFGSLDLQEEIG